MMYISQFIINFAVEFRRLDVDSHSQSWAEHVESPSLYTKYKCTTDSGHLFQNSTNIKNFTSYFTDTNHFNTVLKLNL